MNGYDNSRGMRMLPAVAVATTVVMVVPVALVWWLRAAGVVNSDWLCVAVAIVASVLLAAAGDAYWKRREGSERVVFSELLVWSWMRRMRLERKLATVVELLGGAHARAELGEPDPEQRGEQLRALAAALDAQDPYTEGHSRRVARHAAMVARELGLADDEVERVRAAAAVHDMGKLRIPAALLTKPGKLTPEEFEIVKGHAAAGAELVASLGDAELTAIVRHHHERFDGHGYPSGLAGTEIPLGARIVAVADTFDAITSIRSYRSAASHKQALDRLAEGAGTQLDPAAVRAFVRYYAGRKASVAWVGLAVVPQRLVAWMHGNSGAAGNFAFGEVVATIGSVVAVGAAAMGTAASVGVQSAALAARSPALVAKRTHTPSGGTPRSRGARPGPATTASSVGSTAVGGPRAARTRRGAAHVSLHPSALRTRSHGSQAGGTGSGPRSGTKPGGGSGAGGSATPHPAHTGAPGGRRHRAGGGTTPAPATGSGPTQPGPTAAAPAGPPAPAPASPTSPASPGTPPAQVNGGAPGTPTSPAPPSSGSSGVSSGPPQSVPPSPPPATGPTSKEQCKGGGFAQWGFKNQGQCVASVNGH